MKFLSKIPFLTAVIFLTACSIYQSEGRKFLEKQAFEYSGASAHLLSCAPAVQTQGLILAFANDRAQVFNLPTDLQIRVVPLVDRPYACDYGFTSTAELGSTLSGAIDLTWQRSIEQP